MTMSSYEELVKGLSDKDILNKWKEVTPLDQISGVSRSSGDKDKKDNVFEGYDEEQIRLMDELCIVLDYNDRPIGSGTKKLCHLNSNIDEGLLHRAFSVFLFNEKDELLLQQRAEEKITFPAMWTNTCCSHPLCFKSELGVGLNGATTDINELAIAVAGSKNAAQRKLDHELGIPKSDCPLEAFSFLTRIHYRASSGVNSKWGEHEIDYILILRAKNDITIEANPNEVMDHKFVTKDELHAMFLDDTLVFTPWFKLICESFLFNWWNKLDKLEEYSDDKIHRLL